MTEPLKRLIRALGEGKIAELLSGEPRVTRTTSRSRQRRLTVEQKSELVDQYKAGGESIYSLAKTWGISPHTVSTHLRAAGLSLGFKPLSSAEIKKVHELRGEGLSFNAIGRALGRDPKTIKAAESYSDS
jgi:DNA-binding CsgD family transcriptional regulator